MKKTKKNKSGAGGFRVGAGRKKGPEKVLINFRLLKTKRDTFKSLIAHPNQEFDKWVDRMISAAGKAQLSNIYNGKAPSKK